jgi:capsular polysaccharide biosynthesis protein
MALQRQQRDTEQQLARIAASPDSIASEVAAAGLDMSLQIVHEDRPERPPQRGFVLMMVGLVIGAGTLVAVALVLGAFDSRVHESDDVARLGLPVLGHVPGFAGDNVGSMQTRSVARARVPSFQRWRSHR